MKKPIPRPIAEQEKSQTTRTKPKQTQEEMEEEAFHISTYLTKEDWERPFTPEEEAELNARIQILTKKLAEAGVLKSKEGSNTDSI